MPERRRKYTPEFKDEAAKMVIREGERDNSGAALTWSSWAWVHTMPSTRRSPTAVAITSASCAASTTITSRSSPTSQTLLSTAQIPPSRPKVPFDHLRSPDSRAVRQDHAAEYLAAFHLLEGRFHVVQADRVGFASAIAAFKSSPSSFQPLFVRFPYSRSLLTK